MLEREQELQVSKPALQATSLACIDKRAVTKAVCLQIQLRVVREFGLPDSAIEILQNSQYYYTNSSHHCRHFDQHYPQAQHFQHRQYHASRSSASNMPTSSPYREIEVARTVASGETETFLQVIVTWFTCLSSGGLWYPLSIFREITVWSVPLVMWCQTLHWLQVLCHSFMSMMGS